ncbi:MAG: MBL fold metallo-hydrolase, partial [Bacilli bacterium]|nr:MBL fold metallo-hydrolase [Bacilli bacterium]
MAKKKTTVKKAVKAGKKLAKTNPAAFVVAVVLVAGLAVGGYFAYKYFIAQENTNESSQSSQSSSISKLIINSEAIDINFLELGNKYTGDCTFIKAGDKDILIDAGSRQNSATTIASFVDQYCTDGILEYVIATHAHQDHIAGFVGSNNDQGIFDHYKIDTLIDFSLTNADSIIYNKYVSKRDEKIGSGDIAHHYTANDCIQIKNGAKNVFELNNGTQMKILDQKFYRETSGDENNYSVCALFTQGNNNYLFTGDLEKEGEKSLVELNSLP